MQATEKEALWKKFDKQTWRHYLSGVLPATKEQNLCVGRVSVEVLQATNLPAADYGGTSDPYVKVEMSGLYGTREKSMREWAYNPDITGEKERTKTIKKTLNPSWLTEHKQDKPFQFVLPRHGAVLKLRLFDYDLATSDDLLATLDIPIDDLPTTGLDSPEEAWWRLSKPAESLTHEQEEALNPKFLSVAYAEQLNNKEAAPNEGPPDSTPRKEAPDTSSPGDQATPPDSTEHVFCGAILLRITVERNEYAEFASYFWGPPVLKPRVYEEKFDPDVMIAEILEIIKAATRFMADPANLLLETLKWKKPLLSVLLLAYTWVLTYNIGYFWVIFHFTIGCGLLATGILSRFGLKPLTKKVAASTKRPKKHAPRNKHGHHNFQSAGSAVMKMQKFSSFERSKSSDSESPQINDEHEDNIEESAPASAAESPPLASVKDSLPPESAGEESALESPDSPTNDGKKHKVIPWAIAAPLKTLLGKKFKNKIDGMQHDLKGMRESVELFERTVMWHRKKKGINTLSAMGTFGNFFLSFFHFMVPLRYPSIVAATGLFTFFWVDHCSKMLPIAKKRIRARKQVLSDGIFPPRVAFLRLDERPPLTASHSRHHRQGQVELIIESIFKRIDNDGNGAVSCEELEHDLPDLNDRQKEDLRAEFKDKSTSPEGLNPRDFKAMMLQKGGKLARFLVTAEFKRQLLSDQGTALTKLPFHPPKGIALKFVNYVVASSPVRDKDDPHNGNYRGHTSALRIVKNRGLQYRKRNNMWSEIIQHTSILEYQLGGHETEEDVLKIALKISADNNANARAALTFKLKFSRDIHSALTELLPPVSGDKKTD